MTPLAPNIPQRSRRAFLLAGAGLLAFLHEPASAAEAPDKPLSRAEAIARMDAELAATVDKGFAGAVLLIDHGETVLNKGYGLADPRDQRPMTPQTGFDIGSLVKLFTATAILALEADGKLSTSDPARKYVTELPPTHAAITIGHLLAHTSGLPDIVDSNGKPIRYTIDFDYEPVTRQEIVRRASLTSLSGAPGVAEKYSNLGYSLLAVIVEVCSGTAYEGFVDERIFKPAGMDRTGYLIPHWSRNELAVGRFDAVVWGTPLDHPWLADGPSWNLRGNGGMLSTTGDMAKWISALEKGSVLAAGPRDKLYALNVHRNRRGTRTMGPSGSNNIFDASYLWYLDENRLIIAMTATNRVLAEDLIPKIAARMRDLPI